VTLKGSGVLIQV